MSDTIRMMAKLPTSTTMRTLAGKLLDVSCARSDSTTPSACRNAASDMEPFSRSSNVACVAWRKKTRSSSLAYCTLSTMLAAALSSAPSANVYLLSYTDGSTVNEGLTQYDRPAYFAYRVGNPSFSLKHLMSNARGQ